MHGPNDGPELVRSNLRRAIPVGQAGDDDGDERTLALGLGPSRREGDRTEVAPTADVEDGIGHEGDIHRVGTTQWVQVDRGGRDRPKTVRGPACGHPGPAHAEVADLITRANVCRITLALSDAAKALGEGARILDRRGQGWVRRC